MGKKGKKKKGLPQPGVPLTPEELNIDLTLQIETLERELFQKTRIHEESSSRTMELKAKIDQMQDDFETEEQTSFAVTADMARQYKALQEELIHKINSLETTLTEQAEELDMTKHELEELVKDKQDVIAHKEQLIRELKRRMEIMAEEFQDMLAQLVKSMKENMAAKLNQDADLLNADEEKRNETMKTFQTKLADYGDKLLNNAPQLDTSPQLTKHKSVANGAAVDH